MGTRRARDEISLGVAPILPRDRPGALAVTFVDIPVPDPHLVTFTIRNIGPRHVASADFDRDQPRQVRFPGASYGVARASRATVRVPAVGERPPKSNVDLGRGLLKGRDAWIFTAVVSGAEPTDVFETRALEVQTVTVTMAGLGGGSPLRPRPRRPAWGLSLLSVSNALVRDRARRAPWPRGRRRPLPTRPGARPSKASRVRAATSWVMPPMTHAPIGGAEPRGVA